LSVSLKMGFSEFHKNCWHAEAKSPPPPLET
jgi:hypothetical protein